MAEFTDQVARILEEELSKSLRPAKEKHKFPQSTCISPQKDPVTLQQKSIPMSYPKKPTVVHNVVTA